MAATVLTVATVHLEEMVDAYEDTPDNVLNQAFPFELAESSNEDYKVKNVDKEKKDKQINDNKNRTSSESDRQSNSSHSPSALAPGSINGSIRNGKLRSPMERPSEPEVSIPYTAIFGYEHGTDLNPTGLSTARLEARIIDYEREKSLVPTLSPIIYHIELRYGQFKWTIRRRYNHYRHLHNQIWLFYTRLNLPLPSTSTSTKQTRKALAEFGDVEFPKFPHLPEMFAHDSMSQRMVKKRKTGNVYYYNKSILFRVILKNIYNFY